MKKLLCIFSLLILVFVVLIFFNYEVEDVIYMDDLSQMSIEEIYDYCDKLSLKLVVKEEYSDYPKGSFISQSIDKGDVIKPDTELTVIYSIGNYNDSYLYYKVNELGRIPVMMYHGIRDEEPKYIGGNIDKDGYHRTVEAFKKDLDFYYNNGYRMVRLIDYVNGEIDVPLGMSPIVITFDDGLVNNMKVIGLDSEGELIIDPNCAIGILEEYKKKYSDYNVTATFFVNSSLFNQKEYDEKILKWLIEHGYDIGNHSYNHADFSKIDVDSTKYEIGRMYKTLDSIIGDKYVNIVALPFGSPYKKSHSNFEYILDGSYDGFDYKTVSTLRVGWESDYSPFSNDFDKTLIKRIRAYDNNGDDFDIEYNFNNLKNNRYISDGNKDLIVFPSDKLNKYNYFSDNYITY